MIPVLILAAGQSRRMRGADKLMQHVDGKPLLRRQIQRATPIGPVFVALPSPDHPRHAALEGTTATALVVPQSAEGMGGTMRGAVAQLPKGPFIMLLGDLVDIETKDLQAIVDVWKAYPAHLIWRGATVQGEAGHPIIFDASLRDDFRKVHGDEGGESLVSPLKSATYLHRFSDDRARLDLDTPEDWAAWRSARSN